MPFTFTPLAIPDVVLVQPKVFGDTRGFFVETYHEQAFREGGITARFVQDNHSFSGRGVLRGMHYQLAPFAQGKLVRVAAGAVWDVAVDVRRGSPTFGRWVAQELTGENHTAMWIPPGFAHGFVVLSDYAHFLYKCTTVYSPTFERGFRWDDPAVDIAWPRREVQLSARDVKLPLLADVETP
ncbi:MAG: dTDP-4-dehydrorhamnose 3,5-epimerase [Kiritimatiellae bacterium]|nr:dTDP-4-dehydrorhamnose 3,5-epimerase [Kiritimatiellia bacterium]